MVKDGFGINLSDAAVNAGLAGPRPAAAILDVAALERASRQSRRDTEKRDARIAARFDEQAANYERRIAELDERNRILFDEMRAKDEIWNAQVVELERRIGFLAEQLAAVNKERDEWRSAFRRAFSTRSDDPRRIGFRVVTT